MSSQWISSAEGRQWALGLREEHDAILVGSETALVDGQITPEIKDLVLHQGRRAMGLLRAGAPLGSELRGRIGFEIRLVIAGGAHILRRKLDAYDEPYLRPRITLSSTPALLWRTLRFSGTA